MQENNLKNEIEILKQTLKNYHVKYALSQTNILNALKDKFGDDVIKIVDEVNTKEVCDTYLNPNIIEKIEVKSIANFIKLLWEPLRKLGYEFSIEEMNDAIQIKCTICPIANLYKAINQKQWGFNLYCKVDEALVNAYNEKIGFKRTKTLMEGDDCCDHFYYMKSE